MVTRTRCHVVPEEKVCKIPYTTCRMECEKRSCVQKCKKCTIVTEEKVCKIPYTTCRLVPKEICKMVPVTTCKMEPYCETYKVCRRVPVCVPVGCEPAATEVDTDAPHETLAAPLPRGGKKEE
jgi:hypothetical protein